MELPSVSAGTKFPSSVRFPADQGLPGLSVGLRALSRRSLPPSVRFARGFGVLLIFLFEMVLFIVISDWLSLIYRKVVFSWWPETQGRGGKLSPAVTVRTALWTSVEGTRSRPRLLRAGLCLLIRTLVISLSCLLVLVKTSSTIGSIILYYY